MNERFTFTLLIFYLRWVQTRYRFCGVSSKEVPHFFPLQDSLGQMRWSSTRALSGLFIHFYFIQTTSHSKKFGDWWPREMWIKQCFCLEMLWLEWLVSGRTLVNAKWKKCLWTCPCWTPLHPFLMLLPIVSTFTHPGMRWLCENEAISDFIYLCKKCLKTIFF